MASSKAKRTAIEELRKHVKILGGKENVQTMSQTYIIQGENIDRNGIFIISKQAIIITRGKAQIVEW